MMPMTADMTMADGTVCMTDGTCKMKDGTTMKMKDGQRRPAADGPQQNGPQPDGPRKNGPQSGGRPRPRGHDCRLPAPVLGVSGAFGARGGRVDDVPEPGRPPIYFSLQHPAAAGAGHGHLPVWRLAVSQRHDEVGGRGLARPGATGAAAARRRPQKGGRYYSGRESHGPGRRRRGAGAARRADSHRWRGDGRQQRCEREHAHGRKRAGAKGGGRQGHRRGRQRRRCPQHPGHAPGRGQLPEQGGEDGGRGPEHQVANPDPGRPRRRLAHGRVAGGRRVAVAGQGRGLRHRAHGDGDGDGLPPCAGRGHSAGGGHFHGYFGPQRVVDSQPHGLRGSPQDYGHGDFQSLTGKGVAATVNGRPVVVASPGYLQEKNIALPADAVSNGAETVVFVLLDGQLAGYVALADRIRTDSKEAVQRLQAQGIKVYMATGDNQQVADAVAKELGLDGVYAQVLPDQKVKIVQDLQAQGQFVAMTGDGVNDAPALAQANVGIAVGSGTDIAAETADIILVNSKPTDITNLVEFGKATYGKMMQNLFWATGYNVIALPLAAGIL
nr:probable copper-transporting ATPase HMA5 [Tanacetum cinerariifolium]